MTVSAKRYEKNGITTTLEYGTGGGMYYIKIDDVVIAQCTSYRPAWRRGQDAEQMLAETGWEKK